VGRFYLVTVTMENQASNNSSPTDKGSTVVCDDEGFRITRTSKKPWMMLQQRICGTVHLDPDLGPRPKKRKDQGELTTPTTPTMVYMFHDSTTIPVRVSRR